MKEQDETAERTAEKEVELANPAGKEFNMIAEMIKISEKKSEGKD